MDTSIKVHQKKGRGRPATGRGPAVTSRLTDEIVAGLDAYSDRQPDPKPSRSEMIRKILEDRLVHEGLIPPANVAPAISTQIEALEDKIATIPDADEPSPEAAMNVMRKALAENDLANLKGRQPRPKRK
ncbi:hypothetical protein [Lichenifustis flavocetrariae]|uniref:Ribbon-helix-helix protein CopG domain-containing protein n=1 Tax=Lichenifustis flavocetrariae TaxID=2949735 RepID=A0AA41Z8Z6_9HYPH|nr:hypothetical protein [Lichenifustis flavocetrariae]MCW6511532.1 hypothetical protein [Lichenifustis flavocetrariae]